MIRILCAIFGHEWKWLESHYQGGNVWKQTIRCASCGKRKPYEGPK